MAEAATVVERPPLVQPPKHQLTLREATMLRTLDLKSRGEIPKVRNERARRLEAYIDAHAEDLIRSRNEAGDPLDAAKVDSVKEFFRSTNETFGMTPTERMVQMFEYLDVPSDPERQKIFEEAVENHMRYLGERAFDQHYENPEQYVSHGFDHSMRVANYMQEAVNSDPNFILRITQEYGISPGQAKFMIENVAQFHDCGYCRLAEASSKVAHSMGSLRVFGNDHVRKNIRDLFQQSDNASSINIQKVQYDLEGAILFHNADKIDKGYDARVTATTGEWIGLVDADDVTKVISYYEEMSKTESSYDWYDPKNVVIRVKTEQARQEILDQLRAVFRGRNFPEGELPQVVYDGDSSNSSPLGDQVFYGRKTDLYPGDKAVGLEYRVEDTLGYSLLALLRVGDNLDMLPNRFSEVQRTSAFQELYRKLYGTRLDQREISHVTEEVLTNNPINDPKLRAQLERIAPLLDGESFKHFGGCESLRGVSLRLNPVDLTRAEVVVYVDEPSFNDLQKTTFSERVVSSEGSLATVQLSIAEYQIWRLQQAVRVNLHGGKPITIRILNEEGDDITQQTFLKNEIDN